MGYSATAGWRLSVEYDYIHQDQLRSGTRSISGVPDGNELERETLGTLTDERRKELLEKLEEIEKSVISRKMPGSHAEQVYVLREHIDFVRNKLLGNEVPMPVHSHRSSDRT